MNCLECEELLQRRLDGETIRESDAFELHMNECVSCREQHAGTQLLMEGLRELPGARPAAGWAQALADSVLRDRRHRRDKMRRRVLVTLALAASVMLMLLVGYFSMPRVQGTRPFELAKKAVPPEIELIPGPLAKNPGPRSPLTPLMDRWADTTRDHAKVVQVAMSLDAMDSLPAVNTLPSIDPGVREASEEVSDGVRTVTRNARRAFDFFARELPMPEMPEKN